MKNQRHAKKVRVTVREDNANNVIVFNSLKDAAAALGIKYAYASRFINGDYTSTNPNVTMEYVDKTVTIENPMDAIRNWIKNNPEQAKEWVVKKED